MFRLIYKTSKLVLIVATVLFLGQIDIDGKTVGERFYFKVSGIWGKPGNKLIFDPVRAGAGEISIIPKWFQDKKSFLEETLKRKRTSSIRNHHKISEETEISRADKESLTRVLGGSG